MIKTYTYKLYSNKKVEKKFNKWLGITRYVYNLAKETKEISYKCGVSLTGYDLAKQLTECKKEFTWLKDLHSQTLQETIDRLDTSFKNFYRKRSGYPKWAKKRNWSSFGFKQGVKCIEGVFYLPKFGKVKVHNYRHIEQRNIKTARLVKKADGIYLHVAVEVPKRTYCTNESQVGLDMGIKYFCVTSEGEFIGNPRFLQKQLKKLRVEQRKLSRKKKFSNRWKKQVSVIKRLHKKVTDSRKDFLHKTSTYIATNYYNIAIEDLKISSMVKGNFSQHISDVAWSSFFTLLGYKANNLVRVNPAYSSQECSKCNHVAKENRVTQSIFKCVKCKHESNADLDAAKIIEGRAFPNNRERRTLVQA